MAGCAVLIALLALLTWRLRSEQSIGHTWILLAASLALVFFLFFAVFVVFRIMGRDYDACVISAGFVGLGLGATPVAIANMDVVTRRFGASPKAFLVVPLVGAFFIDLANALVIKFFLALPFMQTPAG